ncbi:lipopolysaccharide biosynthesis protein [Flavobacterium xanthum]|nr:lipopolysaccharide biosynthesis protein [Flavobacterium xanthum]
MGVGLYTSRVVLNTLGIEDFGVYNIVGGIVVLFGFFNSAMSSATQRFLSFDIGKNDIIQLNKTFNATLNIHFLIAIIVLLLAETVGLWFVNYKLNLPEDRMIAVNWVYQFSVLTFLFGIIQVPYNALIIARERMNVYAYISIFEVVFKLLIVYILVVVDYDKLKLYAVLLFLIAFCIQLIEKQYCKKHFEESKYSFYYDKEYTKILLSFSGWSLFGNIASVARSQGNNILLNLFFGTVLNASYGVAMQVQGVVTTFVSNFQMAVNPQIIKQYAAGNKEQSLKLIYQSSKLSFFIMFLITCPIIFNVDYVLELWLKNPPSYTSMFVILSLINILIDTISGPLMIGAQAHGNIKWYQVVIGTLIFLCLPLSYLLLKLYNDPKLVFYAIIGVNFISLFLRIAFLKHMIKLNIIDFIKNVLLKIIFVVSLFLMLFYLFINNIEYGSDFMLFVLKSVAIISSNLILIYFIGINQMERSFILSFIKRKI